MNNDAKLEQIAKLLTDGESTEALRQLREIHGLVDSFQCKKCTLTRLQSFGFRCPTCGGVMKLKVIVEKREGG